ncbi:MAG: MotA/TolQ/ExbB proton channel family protein [Rikenellaceae bacterium]
MTMILQAASAAAQGTKNIGFGELIMAGGWLMIPLAVLFGVSIFIFTERFLALRKASEIDPDFMHQIKALIDAGDPVRAVKLCRSINNPLARMIDKGIVRMNRSSEEVHRAIENVANLEVSKLENGLPFLATISGGAPMIGFLGTVIGMVEAFMNLSQAGGSVDMSLLSSGMYTAMITTVAGLIVGIPAYFGYNYLVARIERLIFEMESNTVAFLDIIKR